MTTPRGTAGNPLIRRGASFGRVSHHLRDPFPAMSHWAGAMAAVVGMGALLMTPLALAGRLAVIVYGLSMVVLFATSAYAHSTLMGDTHEKRVVKWDYSAIFLLIAGTYTPVTVVGLPRGVGVPILVAEWVLAIVGIFLVTRRKKCPTLLRVALYVAMGWMGLVAPQTVITALGWPVLLWLIGGGVVYTVGAVVYVTDRPRMWEGYFVAHDLWHLMVIAGAVCHFVAVWDIVH